MGLRDCEVCEKPFSTEAEWEKLCLVCWKESRSYTLTKGDKAFSSMREEYISLSERLASLEEECEKYKRAARRLHKTVKGSSLSKERLMDMVKLCHPDRHRGSERSERVTKWLLGQIAQIEEVERSK